MFTIINFVITFVIVVVIIINISINIIIICIVIMVNLSVTIWFFCKLITQSCSTFPKLNLLLMELTWTFCTRHSALSTAFLAPFLLLSFHFFLHLILYTHLPFSLPLFSPPLLSFSLNSQFLSLFFVVAYHFLQAVAAAFKQINSTASITVSSLSKFSLSWEKVDLR